LVLALAGAIHAQPQSVSLRRVSTTIFLEASLALAFFRPAKAWRWRYFVSDGKFIG